MECSSLIAAKYIDVGKLQGNMLSNNIMREALNFKQSSRYADESC